MQLLEIWFQQVVSARIYKMDNNIADAPNEMKLIIADIETIAIKALKRQQTIDIVKTPLKPKIKEDHSKQINLF